MRSTRQGGWHVRWWNDDDDAYSGNSYADRIQRAADAAAAAIRKATTPRPTEPRAESTETEESK